MFSVLGWCKIANSPNIDEMGDVTEVADWLKRQLEAMTPGIGSRSDVIYTNATTLLQIMLLSNHENGYFEDVYSLLVDLGERAPGTYGLFHSLDYNVDAGFRCIVMRRGVVEIVADPFFSPVMPTIEDH